MRRVLPALLIWLAGAAFGQEMASSPRPPANPRLSAVVVLPVAEPALAPAPEAAPAVDPEAAAAGVMLSSPRPLRRPDLRETEVAALPPGLVMDRSLRPMRRPAALAERIAALKAASNAPGLDLSAKADKAGKGEVDIAAIAPPSRKEKRRKKREAASMEGAVCGIPSIKGSEIAPITSNVEGCGVAEAVAVTSVAGVRLSQTATVDCSVAKALNQWVDEVAQPAFDGRLVELRVAAHYICRSRNNIRGAKISEHGKGRAVDIAAFILSDGQVLTVKENYTKLLRKIYAAACPYFRTTLGPGSDGYHEDHFHFDAAARDGGAYCR